MSSLDCCDDTCDVLDVAPKPVNIAVQQGTLYQLGATYKDKSGALIDLTGYVFTGGVIKSYGQPVLANFTFEMLDQVTNKGQQIITLPPDQSLLLPILATPPGIGPQAFIYDIVSVNAGSPIRWFGGNLELFPAVSL